MKSEDCVKVGNRLRGVLCIYTRVVVWLGGGAVIGGGLLVKCDT